MWNQNIELEHKSDVEYLRTLEAQRRDLDEEIKKYRGKVDAGNDRRLDAWRAERRASESAGVAEARRTGRNHVSMDEGTEVTATPSGHIFYNMADWY